MPTRTIVQQPIQSGETPDVVFTLVDVNNAAIDIPADVTAMTLTYFTDDNATQINTRLSQDVRGAGSGTNEHTLTNAGLVTWKMEAADTSGITSDTTVVARYTYTYNDGGAIPRTGVHEIQMTIEGVKVVS